MNRTPHRGRMRNALNHRMSPRFKFRAIADLTGVTRVIENE